MRTTLQLVNALLQEAGDGDRTKALVTAVTPDMATFSLIRADGRKIGSVQLIRLEGAHGAPFRDYFGVHGYPGMTKGRLSVGDTVELVYRRDRSNSGWSYVG